MDYVELKKRIAELEKQVAAFAERERNLIDGNEEMIAQKEELTAAIEAFIEKSDSLELSVSELKRRNDELDQLLYRASHDLRAPVSSMEGILELINYEALSPSVKDLHHHLKRQIFQMHDVLKSLNSLSYASFNSISYKPVNLLHLIEEVIASLHYLPHYATIQFTVDIEKDIKFLSDPFLLTILLKSVIANAIVFRSGDKPGEIVILSTQDSDTISITIVDDGEGISAETGGKIFDMFYRGSQRSLGSGMGLYTSRRIVERLGGTITFESNDGKTVFFVSLPIRIKE